ncbi:MAG: hypothetical protein AAFR61_04745 [Bacteroidota bacterium]
MKGLQKKLIIGLLGFLCACTGEDHYLYEVNPVALQADNSQKTKQKSSEQFVAGLYAILFQQSIPVAEQEAYRKLMLSTGDQDLARERIIIELLNRPELKLPHEDLYESDVQTFIREAYRTFYVREPSMAELTYLSTFMEAHPEMTPELIYFSFALSEEYQYY